MLFNSIIAAAVLAYSVSAAPVADASAATASAIASTMGMKSTPTNSSSASSSVSSATATKTGAATPSNTAALPPVDPLLTQKLFLADTAADRFALLPNDKQFVFDFSDPSRFGKGGKGGDLIAANRKGFPALVGTGSGMAVGTLQGCSFNTPHVHPRATELQIVISGSLITEVVPENGVLNDPKDPKSGRRVIRNELGPMQMQPFYQGSVHTQFNPNCEPAVFVASFNAEDFGAGQVLDETFSMSDDIITGVFPEAKNGADVEKFQASIPASIAAGVKECLAKCPPKY
ncbi:RmlC-like cupin domain-containing protein [Tricladium varicosporioides]|nr:RmlC-like cupin domain-containing protein [Hymenoscyphus varicosporioides]